MAEEKTREKEEALEQRQQELASAQVGGITLSPLSTLLQQASLKSAKKTLEEKEDNLKSKDVELSSRSKELADIQAALEETQRLAEEKERELEAVSAERIKKSGKNSSWRLPHSSSQLKEASADVPGDGTPGFVKVRHSSHLFLPYSLLIQFSFLSPNSPQFYLPLSPSISLHNLFF